MGRFDAAAVAAGKTGLIFDLTIDRATPKKKYRLSVGIIGWFFFYPKCVKLTPPWELFFFFFFVAPVFFFLYEKLENMQIILIWGLGQDICPYFRNFFSNAPILSALRAEFIRCGGRRGGVAEICVITNKSG